MTKLLNMFVDESGSANPTIGRSPCYIVCGCLVPEHKRQDLKINADQIKFKYWGKTNIVLHSWEIGRKAGVFSILRDRKVFLDFQKDLFEFLSLASIQLFMVVVDQKEALKRNWNSQKVYKETTDVLVKNFILSLLAQGDVRGKLIIETATAEKDFVFHKTIGHYLSNGLPDVSVSHKNIQDVLTEISFVTKKNHDIEEQIADLFAYGAKLKFLKKNLSSLSAYDQKIMRIMEQKLFRLHPDTGAKKKKFYSLIEGYKRLP